MSRQTTTTEEAARTTAASTPLDAHPLPIHEHPLLAPDAAADELCAALDTVDLAGALWYTHGETRTTLAACTRTDGTRAFPTGHTPKVGPGYSTHTPPRYIDPDPPQQQHRQ
ncbi:hypothetical protein [Rhodococcus wratislaviensis]|uniref:hypothetical protein n=1 Tax=Rhodococcus wratislaviensis TaxID=44752 RepID=UPI00365269AD